MMQGCGSSPVVEEVLSSFLSKASPRDEYGFKEIHEVRLVFFIAFG